MKQYVAGFPAAAVARDQLPFAKAELSTHDNQRVTKALNDGLQAALTGTKTPEQAMKDAQREAERLLRQLQEVASGDGRVAIGQRDAMTRTAQWLYGWLLLLPAAVLLALFTHYPAVANLWHSFYSTPKGSAAAECSSGSTTTAQLVDDPIFWQALTNNFWYALGTIPLSIALALADGGVGQRAARRAAASCASPTSRRRCCR